MKKPFFIIAAVDENNGLGKNNTLVWKLPSDLKHFSQRTTSVLESGKINAVIMGRKTWESLPTAHRPLPGRRNIVLTRDTGITLPEGVVRASSLDEALKLAQGLTEVESVVVIGGGTVYAEAINHPDCEKIYLTRIHATFDCDTFFPSIDRRKFPKTETSGLMQENGLSFEFILYQK